MKICHSDLVKAYQVLMDALSKSDAYSTSDTTGKEFSFAYDYYWNVPIGKRYDIDNIPELDIGSIDHDLERISHCVQDNEPMYHHFRYFGNILIAIADTLEYRFSQGEVLGVFSSTELHSDDLL